MATATLARVRKLAQRLAAVLDALSSEDPQMPRKKMAKATIKKAHRIADAIPSGSVRNRFAVGTATAKKSAAKRKRARAKR